MKGDVVMLLALQTLRGAGALDRLSLVAILIGDEEDSGAPLTLARRDLIDATERADVSFTEGLVDMALDGIGLMGDGGHTRTRPPTSGRFRARLSGSP
ncbi:MAG TPA: hypothetical protein VGV60_06515 [Candidatus Polarisedimenticolia bacterium]|nr:hypothetical protein [Candidatus Polarisedimenticolia bacterium]